MKKSLILLSIIASLASFNAYAKTEGNYVGVSILRSSQDSKYNPEEGYGKFDDSSIGFGLDYNHALNFNDFFVAPGVFAEKIGTKAKDSDGDNFSLDYRYGAKLNIGYDIVDNFAVYLTNGLSATVGKVDWKSFDLKKSSTELDYFYGAGVAFKVNKDIAVNLEYNTQKSNFKTPSEAQKAEAKLNMFKLGVSYNF